MAKPDSSVSFKTGIPSIVEVSAKRHLSAMDAPAGRVKTTVSSKLGIAENSKQLDVQVSLHVAGISDTGDSVAFEVSISVDCQYTFSKARAESDLENTSFITRFCEPLYQRAALQAQDLAWRMGYNAVRLPLMIPSLADSAPPEQAETAKSVVSQRGVRARKVKNA